MSTTFFDHDALTVQFTRWEQVGTRRATVTIPLDAILGATLEPKPLRATRGARRFGILVTGFTKIGTWGLGAGVRQLVRVSREVPAIRVTLDPTRSGLDYDELLVSTPDAAALVAAVTSRQQTVDRHRSAAGHERR